MLAKIESSLYIMSLGGGGGGGGGGTFNIVLVTNIRTCLHICLKLYIS